MSNNSSAEPYVRLDFLDALRFFAIIYVVISHLVLIPQPNLAVPEWIAPFLINGGDAGVSLFFVLSAFSLSHSMNARANEPFSTRNFYIRRFFRIAPLFYFLMLLYWIRDAAVFHVVHPVSEIFINASLLFNLVPSCITGFVWASWTIGVIVLLYLIFPFIHKYIRNLYGALGLFVASVLMAWGWSYFVKNYGVATGYLRADDISFVWGFGFLQHLPVFVCGIIVYHLFFDYLVRMNQKSRQTYGSILILLFIVFYGTLLTESMQNIVWGKKILHGICFSLLVPGLGLKPFGFLVNAKTAYTGKMSYSMYLFHPLLIFTIIPVYRWIYNIIPTDILGYVSSLLLTLALLIAISLMAYKYIERKGIVLGEKLIIRNQ
ncbi:MAG TPA: acyltransferase [Smithella sp.]|nr:acyltransferase [Smithella sp.]MDM7988676.1 acyltransferase [Smithella sp.]HNY49379.1 acyltransferase [Smithella sp.]HOG89430.1 acyltransferase [Smithella sp.]HOU50207.1 acyltransferase [Smithella sp.]